ncbi:MAG: helix-turn-helix transcriptional regulator [Pseudomonadales bacterium]|jgi:DNA-binding HxlR family transcriptional regulator|nr:helix-turn-helix transcriptional regulator [Pseudomonadales bacterium]MBP9035065.1 helix-turn-helix transcriptional regulator [Pseudomonadales bacterium]
MNEAHILPCSPIAKALAVVGDRWSALVMREMFLGTTRFGELVAATGASRATLSKRLRALVANGLLYRNPYQARPPRVEYRLTEKGFGLYDFALAIWAWEARWSRGTDRRLPPKLLHRGCGHKTLPLPVCARCARPVAIHELRYEAGMARSAESATNDGALRRSARALRDGDEGKGLLLHAIDLIADHWTPLVLAAAFMGIRRFDDIRRELGIATNILSHRLKLLVEAGVLQQAPGNEAGKRLEYRLTEKGRGLIVPALALHQWSLQWLPAGKGPSMQLFHDCSPEPLALRMDCSRCRQPLAARDVRFR